MLGCAAKPFGARNRSSSKLPRIRQHSKTPHQRCSFAHSGRHPCSGVLGSRRTLEIIARAYSKPFRARQRFRFSFGIPFGIALRRTVHCFELCESSIKIYGYVYIFYIRQPLLAKGTKAACFGLIAFLTISGHAFQPSSYAFMSSEG